MGEIEKLFYQDVREKKRIGTNIFKRVSTRRGGTNMASMRVPSQKQMREWSGQVMTYNLKEVLPIEEFQKLSDDDKKMYLEFWRKEYKTADIIEMMGTNKNVFYRMLKALGIKKADRRPVKYADLMGENDTKTKYKGKVDNTLKTDVIEEIKPIDEEPKKVELEHTVNIAMLSDKNENAFEFSLKGTYNSETLVRRLEILISEIENAEEKLDITLLVKG